VPDGVRASSNGRVLALWDVRGSRATLVDTAAPDVDRTLRLGICRGNGLTEASADGRWFRFVDCFENLRIADLAAESLGSSALGLKQTGHVAFALDGMVHVAGLPGAAPPRPAAQLPVLDLAGAALDLTVVPIDASAAGGYEFHGTFAASGAGATGETWPLAGRADAHGLHRYLPTAPSVAPAALPPPAAIATATAIDPETGVGLCALSFSTKDRNATSFIGVLHDVVATSFYRVRVRRAGHAEP